MRWHLIIKNAKRMIFKLNLLMRIGYAKHQSLGINDFNSFKWVRWLITWFNSKTYKSVCFYTCHIWISLNGTHDWTSPPSFYQSLIVLLSIKKNTKMNFCGEENQEVLCHTFHIRTIWKQTEKKWRDTCMQTAKYCQLVKKS